MLDLGLALFMYNLFWSFEINPPLIVSTSLVCTSHHDCPLNQLDNFLIIPGTRWSKLTLVCQLPTGAKLNYSIYIYFKNFYDYDNKEENGDEEDESEEGDTSKYNLDEEEEVP